MDDGNAHVLTEREQGCVKLCGGDANEMLPLADSNGLCDDRCPLTGDNVVCAATKDECGGDAVLPCPAPPHEDDDDDTDAGPGMGMGNMRNRGGNGRP